MVTTASRRPSGSVNGSSAIARAKAPVAPVTEPSRPTTAASDTPARSLSVTSAEAIVALSPLAIADRNP